MYPLLSGVFALIGSVVVVIFLVAQVFIAKYNRGLKRDAIQVTDRKSVCAYVCMCLCVCACVYVYVYEYLRVCVCVCVLKNVRVCMLVAYVNL